MALLSPAIHSRPSTSTTRATITISASPRSPPSAMACAAIPGGPHRTSEARFATNSRGSPPKPRFRSRLGSWVSRITKTTPTASTSRPRRVRSTRESAVVTALDATRHSATCSTTATRPISTPVRLRDSPTTAPPRKHSEASGHGPVAEAANMPTAIWRAVSGNRVSRAGSSVSSTPKTSSGPITQISVSRVNSTTPASSARSAGASRSRLIRRSPPQPTMNAAIIVKTKPTWRMVSPRRFPAIRRSFRRTNSQAMPAPLGSGAPRSYGVHAEFIRIAAVFTRARIRATTGPRRRCHAHRPGRAGPR